MQTIITTVTKFYCTSLEEINNRSRKNCVCTPRQLIMVLLRIIAGMKQKDIASIFLMHYTTVHHSMTVWRNYYETDAAMSKVFIAICRTLQVDEKEVVRRLLENQDYNVTYTKMKY